MLEDSAPQAMPDTPAYRWRGGRLEPVTDVHDVQLDGLLGIDRQKAALTQNTRQFVEGRVTSQLRLPVGFDAARVRIFDHSAVVLGAGGAILLDISRSTESAVTGRAVIEIEREALAALAWGIEAAGDSVAVHAFSSLRRNRVFVQRCKDFSEPMGPAVEARIAGLRPGFYTRLGAAVRHVSAGLARAGHARRLLLVITDGKPNDLDHYEGRHGIEDSRMAIREARRAGHAVYGIAVDAEGKAWFPRIFGRGGYAVIAHPDRLTRALPEIYRHLVAT